jgi:hypothetical protein
MPDGPRLLTEVYLPAAVPAPVIFARTPYGSRSLGWLARALVPSGYVVVVQNVRGTNGSGGAFVPFVTEQADGRATLEWILSQPWATDTVGLFGISYHGYTAYALAETGAPAVRALAVFSGWAELGEFIAPGGAFNLMAHLPWFISFGRGARMPPVAMLDSLFRTVPLSGLFRGAEAVMQLAERPYNYAAVKVPVLHVTSWYDFIYPHALRAYAGLRAQGQRAAPQRLIVGPWAHNDVLSGKTVVGDDDFGAHAVAGFDSVTAWTRRWFDRHLRSRAEDEPPVRLFVLGDNRWRNTTDWPPTGSTAEAWYLHADGDGGHLAPTAQRGRSTSIFTYDPNEPAPTVGGANTHFLPDRLGPRDQRVLDGRTDIVRFISTPLERDLLLAGPMQAVLYVSADAPSTDITAKLVAVLPDGRARNIEDGIRRFYLKPGAPTEVTIDLGATAIRLSQGTRLRLDISGGNFPKYDRNPNTGEDPLSATLFRPVRLTIHHDADAPSRVVLPVWRLAAQPGRVTFSFEPGDSAHAAHVERVAAAAIRSIESFFELPFRDPITIRILPDRAVFDAYFSKAWGMAKTECWMVGAAAPSDLVLLSPRVWSDQACEHDPRDRAHVSGIVAHELVHVLHGQYNPTTDFEGMDALGWFVEGVAVLASGQLETRRGDARAALVAGAMPAELADVWTGRFRYGLAGSLVEHVDRTRGRGALRRLLAATTQEQALEILGVTEQQLLAGWKASIGRF